MDQKTSIKPLAFALGAAFATTLSGTGVVNAADNPFAMTEIPGGHMVADAAEGMCGAGEKSATEGKCHEDKCGGNKWAVHDRHGPCVPIACSVHCRYRRTV